MCTDIEGTAGSMLQCRLLPPPQNPQHTRTTAASPSPSTVGTAVGVFVELLILTLLGYAIHLERYWRRSIKVLSTEKGAMMHRWHVEPSEDVVSQERRSIIPVTKLSGR